MKRLLLLIIFILIPVLASYALPTANDHSIQLNASFNVDDNQSLNGDENANVEENNAAENEKQPEKKKKKPRLAYGLMIGIYSPLNAEVRDTFGDDAVRFGLRSVPIEFTQRWRMEFDVSYYELENAQNKTILIPVTLGLMRGLGEESDAIPYMAVNAGSCYCDVRAPDFNVDSTGWAFTANATLGVTFKKRLFLELRYEYVDDFKGFDFSSFSASLAYRIFTIKM